MGIPIYFGTKLYGWIDNGDGTSDATQFFHVYYIPIIPTGSFTVLSHDPATGESQVVRRGFRAASVLGTYFKVWGFLGSIGLVAAACEGLGRGRFLSGGILGLGALSLMLAAIAAWFFIGRQPGAPSTLGRKIAMPILFAAPVVVLGLLFTSSVRSGLRYSLTRDTIGKDAASQILELARFAEARDLAQSEQRCAAGSSSACFAVARRYEIGQRAPRDAVRARQYYRKACDAGSGPGCFNLGLLLVDTSPGDATTAYLRGCELGYADACLNAGAAHAKGRGVPRDVPRAVALYQKACDGKSGIACNNLGNLYREGDGVPRSQGQAIAFFRRACDAGHAGGCANLKAPPKGRR